MQIDGTARDPESMNRSEVQNIPFSLIEEWSKTMALPPYNMTEQWFRINGTIMYFKTLEELKKHVNGTV